jgi:hypothetical protein
MKARYRPDNPEDTKNHKRLLKVSDFFVAAM